MLRKMLVSILPLGVSIGVTASLLAPGSEPAEARPASDCLRTACARTDSIFKTRDNIVVRATRPATVGTSPIASFPSVFVDGRDVWVTYSLAEDLPGATRRFQTLRSTNRGITFKKIPGELSVENAISTPSGPLAFAEAANTYPDRMSARITGWRGKQWTSFVGKLHFRTKPKRGGGATFNHGMLRVGRALLAPYYGRFRGDVRGLKTNRVEVAISKDQGQTWRTHGTVMRPWRRRDGYIVSYSEASMVKLDARRIMLVARAELYDRSGARISFLPMEYKISRNGGRTWGSSRQVRINNRATAYGGRPTVLRMSNGTFVLATGRPDNVLTFARRRNRDGSPRWTGHLLGYRNYAQKRLAGGYVYRVSGSSGYPAVAAISPSKLIGVFDNCAATWGCNAPKSGFTVSKGPVIKRRFVTLRRR